MSARSIALCALLMLSGCSAITDPGRFQDYKDFSLQLHAFHPHLNNRVDIALVAEIGDTGSVEGRILLVPLGDPETSADLFDTIDPGRAYHVDFFADFNNSGTYDAPDTDHSWRIPVAPNGVATYTHDFNFTNLTTTPPMAHGDAIVHLSNATAFDGMKVEARIYNPISENVGYVRITSSTGGDVSFTLGGIIDAGSDYSIDITVGDRACSPRITATASTDLVIERDAADFSCP